MSYSTLAVRLAEAVMRDLDCADVFGHRDELTESLSRHLATELALIPTNDPDAILALPDDALLRARVVKPFLTGPRYGGFRPSDEGRTPGEPVE